MREQLLYRYIPHWNPILSFKGKSSSHLRIVIYICQALTCFTTKFSFKRNGIKNCVLTWSNNFRCAWQSHSSSLYGAIFCFRLYFNYCHCHCVQICAYVWDFVQMCVKSYRSVHTFVQMCRLFVQTLWCHCHWKHVWEYVQICVKSYRSVYTDLYKCADSLRIVIAFYGHTLAGGCFICHGDIMAPSDCSFVQQIKQTNTQTKTYICTVFGYISMLS